MQTTLQDLQIRDELLRTAQEASSLAYCPYSRFRVGAAVLADGRIFSGCNIENASLGLTICAERVAIFKAINAGARRISAIAVACPDAPVASLDTKGMPCGACRQVMAEFADENLPIYVDRVRDFTLGALMPKAFQL